jgi:hypothetical protein
MKCQKVQFNQFAWNKKTLGQFISIHHAKNVAEKMCKLHLLRGGSQAVKNSLVFEWYKTVSTIKYWTIG